MKLTAESPGLTPKMFHVQQATLEAPTFNFGQSIAFSEQWNPNKAENGAVVVQNHAHTKRIQSWTNSKSLK